MPNQNQVLGEQYFQDRQQKIKNFWIYLGLTGGTLALALAIYTLPPLQPLLWEITFLTPLGLVMATSVSFCFITGLLGTVVLGENLFLSADSSASQSGKYINSKRDLIYSLLKYVGIGVGVSALLSVMSIAVPMSFFWASTSLIVGTALITTAIVYGIHLLETLAPSTLQILRRSSQDQNSQPQTLVRDWVEAHSSPLNPSPTRASSTIPDVEPVSGNPPLHTQVFHSARSGASDQITHRGVSGATSQSSEVRSSGAHSWVDVAKEEGTFKP